MIRTRLKKRANLPENDPTASFASAWPKPDKPALELMRGRGASWKGAGIRPCSRFGFWGSVFAQWLRMS
jgi:hypothetical protein